MNERLSLEGFTGASLDLPQEDLNALAGIYARVFSGEPWNEYTKCPRSGLFFGMDTEPNDVCPESNCGSRLNAAYPLGQTAAYITQELARPDAALLLLRDKQLDSRLVGFSWGFSYDSPDAFASDKYTTPTMRTTVAELLPDLGLGVNGLWYLSESGIEPSERYRGKGISREFHNQRLEIAHSLGLDAVQRTSAYGNMYRTSQRTMTQIMGIETEPDTARGKLVPTGRIVNGITDSEVNGRALFAKKHDSFCSKTTKNR